MFAGQTARQTASARHDVTRYGFTDTTIWGCSNTLEVVAKKHSIS